MIGVLSCTNREGSYTLRVARWYYERLTERGASASLLDFRTLPHDFLFSDLYDQRSEAGLQLLDALCGMDTYVFVTPEYNGSFPGVLKVVIDAFDPKVVFRGKKAALVGLSDGMFGNLRGLEHLTGVLHYMQTHVLPYKVHLPRIATLFSAEGLADEAAKAQIEAQIDGLLQWR